MRFVATRSLAILAMAAGIILTPAVPTMAATAEARASLRDRLAELAPVGSSAVIDPATGEVVVRVAGTASREFTAAVSRHRPVRTVSSAPVQTTAILRGGQAMNSYDGRLCTTGLVTQYGSTFYLITAGHCLIGAQSPWWGEGGAMIGPAHSATFPGSDFGLLRVSDVSPLTPRSEVASYTGYARIGGVADVAVGTSVCKTGLTTGTTCGTVLAKNATYHFHQGVVYGLIETDACTAAGDSGAPLISTRGGYGSRSKYGAFGILSGSNGVACDGPGHRSAFQPLPPVMSYYGLQLPEV